MGKNTAAIVHANSRRSHMLLSSTLYVSPTFSCSLGVKTTKESCWPFGAHCWINRCDSDVCLLICLFLGLSVRVLYIEEQPLKAFIRSWSKPLGWEQAGITHYEGRRPELLPDHTDDRTQAEARIHGIVTDIHIHMKTSLLLSWKANSPLILWAAIILCLERKRIAETISQIVDKQKLDLPLLSLFSASHLLRFAVFFFLLNYSKLNVFVFWTSGQTSF